MAKSQVKHSSKTKRSPGRPESGKDDARNALILAARECFSQLSFREVTTRMVAEKAGVNAALIRYYFINKDGLYQQMLASVAEQFQSTMLHHLSQQPDNPFEAVFLAHRELATSNPDIPRLIFKELVFNEGHGRQVVIDNVARPNKLFMDKLFQGVLSGLRVRKDFDPTVLLISTLSMSLMPHLLKPVMEELEGKPIDQLMAEKFVWQNSQMIRFGCLERE